MLSSALLSVIAGTFAVVSAQDSTVSTYAPFNPDDIQEATKRYWCVQQLSSCSLLCLDQKSGPQFDNTCDPETLQWTCICDDGKTPNTTQYSQTIPYFQCTAQVEACVAACGNANNNCAYNCRANKPCGASDPQPPTTKTQKGSKATASATSTASSDDVAYDGLGGGDAKETDSAENGGGDSKSSNDDTIDSAGNNLVAFGEAYGLLVLAGSFGFSLYAFLQ